MFRVIPAQEYLDVFASDRSHMLKEDKITYNSPPPSYPPICNQSRNNRITLQDHTLNGSLLASTNNINDFIDMQSKHGPGTVMNLVDFRRFLEMKKSN